MPIGTRDAKVDYLLGYRHSQHSLNKLTNYLLGDKMTEIVQSKTFEERMKERIRDSIGDLISDEDLGKMVDRSLEEVFFKERANPARNAYGYNSSEPIMIPPLLHEIVKSVLTEQVTEAVKEYIGNNREQVDATIKTVLEQGMGNALVSALNGLFSSQLASLQVNLANQFNRY